ncbi:hypothetical protein CAAN1_17S01156 [[Candida] anglica]|uniref:Uncharacterized protein n=1 Tax=[Candida] anglica TaxID=148631 RepID=A0ABP0E7H2_9ASCO
MDSTLEKQTTSTPEESFKGIPPRNVWVLVIPIPRIISEIYFDFLSKAPMNNENYWVALSIVLCASLLPLIPLVWVFITGVKASWRSSWKMVLFFTSLVYFMECTSSAVDIAWGVLRGDKVDFLSLVSVFTNIY